METTNLLWLIVLVLVVVALLLFIRKGRSHGYLALTKRTNELRGQGIEKVFLIYSVNNDVSAYNPIRGAGSILPAFSTGALAYVKDDNLYFEVPHWDKIVPLKNFNFSELNIEEANFLYASRRKPGLRVMGYHVGVAGVNIEDINQLKQALKLKNKQDLDSNRKIFANYLNQNTKQL